MSSASLPLTTEEEVVWRSLARLTVVLHRSLDRNMSDQGGLSLTRYVVLMRLSEAPDRTLRMGELADAASLSASRVSRVIQDMLADGWVDRSVSPADARASLATLTDKGLAQLERAWPAHLAAVRSLVMDHIGDHELPVLADVLGRLVEVVESTG